MLRKTLNALQQGRKNRSFFSYVDAFHLALPCLRIQKSIEKSAKNKGFGNKLQIVNKYLKNYQFVTL